jgi:hypothetical protein
MTKEIWQLLYNCSAHGQVPFAQHTGESSVQPSSLQLQGPVRGGVVIGNKDADVLVEDKGIATALSGAGGSKTQVIVMFTASVLLSDAVQLGGQISASVREVLLVGGCGVPI